MYGVERSVVALARPDGRRQDYARRQGQGRWQRCGRRQRRRWCRWRRGGGVQAWESGIAGKKPRCLWLRQLQNHRDSRPTARTMFVFTWNCILNTEFVMLLTKSAVPIPPPPRMLKPKPRFGLFGSPIVLAAALTIVLMSVRSWTAGVARAVGTRMMPLKSMLASSGWTLV
jgi:hypothetical protein